MAVLGNRYMIQGGAGLRNGVGWANAFDEPAYEIWKEGVLLAGWAVWIMDGAYIADSDIDSNARDGTAVNPISEIGVKAGTTNEPPIHSDWSIDEADKPFFDMVTFTFRIGRYERVRNISFQGSNTFMVYGDYYDVFENCKFDNDWVASANRMAIYTGGGNNKIYNCEITSANCTGIRLFNACTVKWCYIHDCPDAAFGTGIFFFNGGNNIIEYNIIADCEIGIEGSADLENLVDNNTFYRNTIGISETTGYMWSIINNSFTDCPGGGIVWGVETDCNFIWNNHYNNCGANVNVDNATLWQDYEIVAGLALFTNPGVDFSVQAGSPLLNSAMSEILGVGL